MRRVGIIRRARVAYMMAVVVRAGSRGEIGLVGRGRRDEVVAVVVALMLLMVVGWVELALCQYYFCWQVSDDCAGE